MFLKAAPLLVLAQLTTCFSLNTVFDPVFAMSEDGWTNIPGANLPLENDE